MKTYVFDTFNRYKRLSEAFDIKTILCNKPWWVFNDTGEKEVYIFEEDNNLIISVNGVVTKASWRYIAANKSIMIDSSGSTVMLRPAFVDLKILTLQLDGTENYAFLIDENNKELFNPKTLSEFESYFENKINEIEQSKIPSNIDLKIEISTNEKTLLELKTNYEKCVADKNNLLGYVTLLSAIFIIVVTLLVVNIIYTDFPISHSIIMSVIFVFIITTIVLILNIRKASFLTSEALKIYEDYQKTLS